MGARSPAGAVQRQTHPEQSACAALLQSQMHSLTFKYLTLKHFPLSHLLTPQAPGLCVMSIFRDLAFKCAAFAFLP